MSDVPSAPAAPPAPPAASNRGILPILAIVFAGLALILAFAAAGIAWLPAIAAIILAIIALVKKAQPRILAILAIIIAPLAWLIAIIVAVAGLAAGLGSTLDTSPGNRPATAQSQEEATEDEAAEDDGVARIGDTVTNTEGVSVTFQSVTCGLASAGSQFLEETAKGQFCEVTYYVQNDGTKQISLWASDITGEIGGIEYKSNTTVSTFGGDYFTTDLNPGLGTDAVVYIDIPADKALDFVVYDPQWNLFTQGLRVQVG